MTAQAAAVGQVKLTIPPRAEYVLLARLALSAICRLTPLAQDENADLKLAVTEAAAMRGGAGDAGDPLSFDFRLEQDRLVIDVAGGEPSEQRDIARALVEASVDECEFGADSVRLVKALQ